MNSLCVPLAAVTESGVAIDTEVTAAQVWPGGVPEVPVESIAVRGVLSEVSEEYFFNGTVSGTYVCACDRCLEEVHAPFASNVVWRFMRGPAKGTREEAAEDEGEDEDAGFAFTFEGNEIDLTPRVREEVVLAEPLKVLCNEECAGLCPQCGANLNRGACACRQEESQGNTGFAGLADLFPEFRAERSKE